MPAKSENQRRVAAMELKARREGKRKKQKKDARKRRPFGTATLKTLRDFASG